MRITLCGSIRFIDKFREWNKTLTACGHTVHSLGYITKSEDNRPEQSVKEILDLVHFQKILNSDAILVIGAETHLGFSTQREIHWARMNEKEVYFEEKDGAMLLIPPLAPYDPERVDGKV